MSQRCIQVAIGLIFHQSQVLVGWRNHAQHQGNKYEFPGGKVETGESAVDACRREILEEVGVDIAQWHVFAEIEHQYDDLTVKLHIFHAQLDQSQMSAIQSPWSWYSRPALAELNFPAANQVIIQRLLWPKSIKIAANLEALEQLATDCQLYLRCQTADIETSLAMIGSLAITDVQRLIVNIELWSLLSPELQANIGAVHFKQQQLLALTEQDIPRQIRCIAACHDQQAIAQANALGFEAIILSPVLATPTHPEQQGLGWERFAQLATETQLPVFALGGMSATDLKTVEQQGGYGVAGIRHF